MENLGGSTFSKLLTGWGISDLRRDLEAATGTRRRGSLVPREEPLSVMDLENRVSGQDQGLTARSIAVEADGIRRVAGFNLPAPVQRSFKPSHTPVV